MVRRPGARTQPVSRSVNNAKLGARNNGRAAVSSAVQPITGHGRWRRASAARQVRHCPVSPAWPGPPGTPRPQRGPDRPDRRGALLSGCGHPRNTTAPSPHAATRHRCTDSCPCRSGGVAPRPTRGSSAGSRQPRNQPSLTSSHLHAQRVQMKHPKDSQREVGGGLACRPRNQVMTYVSSRESAKLHNDLHDELGYIRIDSSQISIGALARHRELLDSDGLAAAFPIFRDAERVIADPVVRNRGTIGGSLCQADPSEDLTAVCTAVNASCVIRGSSGDRVVTMEEFHRGPYETAVGDGEMLVEIRIPIKADGSSAYEKVERRAGDWAVVSAGAAVWMAGAALNLLVGARTTRAPSRCTGSPKACA